MRNRVLKCFLFGVILSVPLFVWVVLSARTPSPEEYAAKRFAKNTGLSGQTLLKILGANKSLRARSTTEDDWQVIEENAQSPSVEFRANAILALSFARGTRFDVRARAILHRLASDQDPGVQLIAVNTLCKIGDPRAQEFLTAAKNSTNEIVRSRAAKYVIKGADGVN